MEDKVKWRPEFKRIEKQLNDLKDEIRLTGHEMSDKEVLEGFGG
jgi:phage-related minor tail protein